MLLKGFFIMLFECASGMLLWVGGIPCVIPPVCEKSSVTGNEDILWLSLMTAELDAKWGDTPDDKLMLSMSRLRSNEWCVL